MAIVGWTLLLLLLAPVSRAEIGLVGPDELREARSLATRQASFKEDDKDNYPDNSYFSYLKWFGETAITLTILTPRARATNFAAWASERSVTLDSTNWYPEMFNDGVMVKIESIKRVFDPMLRTTPGSKKVMSTVLQLERVVCLTPNDSVVKPTWTKLDSTLIIDPKGHESMAVDLNAIFPTSLFDLQQDLRFVVFGNRGRHQIKIKAKKLRKLY